MALVNLQSSKIMDSSCFAYHLLFWWELTKVLILSFWKVVPQVLYFCVVRWICRDHFAAPKVTFAYLQNLKGHVVAAV